MMQYRDYFGGDERVGRRLGPIHSQPMGGLLYRDCGRRGPGFLDGGVFVKFSLSNAKNQ
jgi:hypothetical protein